MTTTTSPKVYGLRKYGVGRVEDQHRSRTLHDLDAGSTLNWVDDGASSTAHWRFDGTSHHIQVNREIVSLIDAPAALLKKEHKRQEMQFVKSVHNHEVAHALYTSRDFKRVNQMCKDNDLSFSDFNLFEDARIEGIFRQRRPFKVSKKLDIDHEGSFAIEPMTYGVRKFGWVKWNAFNFDNPRNMLLNFIKAEGTKKHLDALRDQFNAHPDFKVTGDPAIDGACGAQTRVSPDVSAFTGADGKRYVFDWFLAIWRDVAGRRAEHRYPTTENLITIIKHFNKIFPAPAGGNGIEGLGGGDYGESAKRAGEVVHEPGGSGSPTETPPPPPPEKPKPTIDNYRDHAVDEKRSEPDEARDKIKDTMGNRAMLYFDWD